MRMVCFRRAAARNVTGVGAQQSSAVKHSRLFIFSILSVISFEGYLNGVIYQYAGVDFSLRILILRRHRRYKSASYGHSTANTFRKTRCAFALVLFCRPQLDYAPAPETMELVTK